MNQVETIAKALVPGIELEGWESLQTKHPDLAWVPVGIREALATLSRIEELAPGVLSGRDPCWVLDLPCLCGASDDGSRVYTQGGLELTHYLTDKEKVVRLKRLRLPRELDIYFGQDEEGFVEATDQFWNDLSTGDREEVLRRYRAQFIAGRIDPDIPVGQSGAEISPKEMSIFGRSESDHDRDIRRGIVQAPWIGENRVLIGVWERCIGRAVKRPQVVATGLVVGGLDAELTVIDRWENRPFSFAQTRTGAA